MNIRHDRHVFFGIVLAALLFFTFHPYPIVEASADLPPITGVENDISGPKVLASTAWVAAIAEAAGASDVDILAPFELRHPPERDFRPSDITRAVSADVVMWAGYEGFMQQLVQATDIPADRSVQVLTENSPDHLIELTRELAARWGTEYRQAAWEKQFIQATEKIEQAAKAAGVADLDVIATVHMVPFLNWLGYRIVDTFGFEEITPVRIFEWQQLDPNLIVDVWHNPTGQPLAEATGARYVALINFPGHEGTRSLIDVFYHNATELGLDL